MFLLTFWEEPLNRSNCVKIKVLGNTALSIFDTGATLSAISGTYFQTLDQISKLNLQDCLSYTVNTAPGAPLVVMGMVDLVVDFGGRHQKIRHQFKVIKDLKYDVILTADFIRDHGVELNFKKGMVRLRPSYQVRLQGNVTIPAQSVSVLWGTLKGTGFMPTGVQGMFTGVDCMKKMGIAVAKSISQMTNGKIPIQVMNLQDKDFVLRINTRLGNFDTCTGNEELSIVDFETGYGEIFQYDKILKYSQ